MIDNTNLSAILEILSFLLVTLDLYGKKNIDKLKVNIQLKIKNIAINFLNNKTPPDYFTMAFGSIIVVSCATIFYIFKIPLLFLFVIFVIIVLVSVWVNLYLYIVLLFTLMFISTLMSRFHIKGIMLFIGLLLFIVSKLLIMKFK